MQRNIPWTNSLAPGSKMRSIVQHFSEFKKIYAINRYGNFTIKVNRRIVKIK